jgi:imidazoleglycerol-phosphate dehydratase / histidinol-phosphatase
MQTKKVLFIDRDGTLVLEPPKDFQLDSLEKLEFYPGVFQWMSKISKLGYELVMVTNQDALGTESFPEETFWPAHNKCVQAFENEGVVFNAVKIDRSLPADNAPTRKPKTGMLTEYLGDNYDLANSYVIGDRLTDVELAKNLGAKAIYLGDNNVEGYEKLKEHIALTTANWQNIYEMVSKTNRTAVIERNTLETRIKIKVDLNGNGESLINTGIKFFDHMLNQIAKHGLIDLSIQVIGDLEVDGHHTIEDTAIALGEAIFVALGNKKGIERYGFCLPMDDCLAQVAIDFGGRNWIEWKADFKRELIGIMPTEMFFHFFKSFSDGAKCNLNIKAEGINEHHKIEAIFKAFAKAIKMAVKQDQEKMFLPSTKGML